MRRWGSLFVFLICVAFSASAIYNVMHDNADVERKATSVACAQQEAGCHAQKTREERTPFAQTFEFATAKRVVGVRCTRELVMVGDYACALR
jgi:hypothetical protein